ncbi:MAG: hypothetical protein AB7F32_06490, partial [Victivallaceae bacterium]
GDSLGRRGPDAGPETPYTTSGTSPGWETAALWYADGTGGNPYDGGNCRNLAHPPYTFTGVEFEPGVLQAVGYRGGVRVAEHEIRTAGEVAGVVAELRDEGVPAGPYDVLFADVRVVDGLGVTVTDWRGVVSLGVGGGEVIGEASKPLEMGLATFLVRMPETGEVTLTATIKK